LAREPGAGRSVVQDGRKAAIISFDVTPEGFRAVPRTHLGLIAGGLAMSLESDVPQGATVLSAFAPMSFAGLASSLVVWLLSGGTLVLHHPFDDFPDSHKVLKLGSLERSSFGNYLHTMHFFDQALEDFKTALIGRIGSLAKTHLLLTDEGHATTFADILHSELDAFDDGSDNRIRLSGPGVDLPSRLAVSIGMAIHELTTNAAKYGALSVYGGKVDVTWTVIIDATRRTLNFDWVENGGPPVSPPKRQGFGSRLLEFVLPGQIQAKSQIEYRADGVRVHCSMPMPAETAQ